MTEWELLLREEGLGIHPTPSCTDLYLVNGENMVPRNFNCSSPSNDCMVCTLEHPSMSESFLDLSFR